MDFDIPAEAAELVGVAREFATTDLAAAEVFMDRATDQVDAFSSETYLAFRQQVRSIGLHQILLPEEIGGLGLSPEVYFLVLEELAAGGPGLALVMQTDALGAALAATRRKTHRVYEEYLEAFVHDTRGVHSGAWAITEPDVGSDMYDPDSTFRVRARATTGGAGFVINGAKSSWCSNGWLADMLCVMITVEPKDGMNGTGIFLIPADWPGISKGTPVSKVGLRALNQCDISFDDVEVPKEFMIIPPGPHYPSVLKKGFIAPGNTAVGCAAQGISRAAYRIGLAYAKQRRQGGKTIIEHQLPAKRVFDAYTAMESAGLMLRRSAWNLSRGVFDMAAVYSARVHACRTSAQVTAEMVYLHGGNGITTEYPIEKLWRDAQPLQFADGTTDVVSLQAAKVLAGLPT